MTLDPVSSSTRLPYSACNLIGPTSSAQQRPGRNFFYSG